MSRANLRRRGAGAMLLTLALLSGAAAPGAAAALPAGPGEPAGRTAAAPGQSDQPAPPSSRKRVIGAVHTDTVSAFLDQGTLTVASRADIDLDGDGVPDLGSRLDPSGVLFHLDEPSRTTVPAGDAYAFLGAAGAPVWLAPQIQDHRLLWPGFSTEDPALAGTVHDGRLAVRMLGAAGPGEVEIFLQDGGAVRRVFSSTSDLPSWQTGVPQHTHMNWAFTQPGTYELEFEMRGVVGGREQAAANRYTFVVGDLAAHTRSTSTGLRADRSVAAPGEAVTLVATVAPAVAGAVQFRDLGSNVMLGHAPVAGDGSATFRTSALVPGGHQIRAEFVPTWADDATTSASAPIDVTVTGTAEPEPDHDDTVPVPDDRLDPVEAGAGLTVTTPQKRLAPGGTVTARVTGALAGRWVSVWVHAPEPSWYGWLQADLTGGFSVDLADDLPAGDARLVVKDAEGALLGWDRFTLVPASNGNGGDGSGPPPVAPPPTSNPEPPQAATQQCAPALVLDRGHVDLFFVSAANGKAVLQLVEDVTGHRVVHEAETVLLRVDEAAYRANIPAGTPGAPAGYVLPLTQSPDLVWPGWDTNRTAASGHTDVTIDVTGVDGPGRVHLYSQGSFGDIRPLLQGGSTALPGSIREPTPAHTHAQWVFSAPGVYRLTAHATATNPQSGATLTTAAHTYVFQVGDVPIGDVFCGMTTHGVADAAEVNAAVDRAAAEAVAANQAADPETLTRARGPGNRGATDDVAHDETTRATGAQHPMVLIAVIGGGTLVVLGLAGATWWYVRRLREPGPAAAGPSGERG
ncbi:choice-of-anchor M domain-containing protein [Agromyces silvae]|uniref:choice-of-anchor M domain-containing protein n=1 Tax=Agromyces silvae TaxID=3388266 RepID=UPI00280C007F|nr:choice-of-anchor M domain-containing protein [Agromyces protaetiae]